ncbi:hypothetical protein DL96DRAFT_1669246 [Flagelloscypha sp. PMI_526]|nr:hypothetical protein DL96DRAFT_1669246 [Flagelloscypha sp. PMI_526]
MGDSPRTFTIASRSSKLAQVQTNSVLAALEEIHPPSSSSSPRFATHFTSNEAADVDKTSAIYLMGGKALWTKELEVALVNKNVDMLVHSFKDVPTELPPGCIIAGVMEREDPADSLLVKEGSEYKSISDLPAGSILQRQFPHLKDTRMSKLNDPQSPFSAIILAKAGLLRTNMAHHIAQDLTPPYLFHAVSQGALGIEVREDDLEAIALCESITHWQSKWRCWAERGMLRVLEGGCSVPVGVSTSLIENVDGTKVLSITGAVTSLDGSEHVEKSLEENVKSLEEAEALGKRLAQVLVESGAKKILDDINSDKQSRISELKG